jgi:hypothetical protein
MATYESGYIAACRKMESLRVMLQESHRRGFEREATFGLIAVFVVMTLLGCLLF